MRKLSNILAAIVALVVLSAGAWARAGDEATAARLTTDAARADTPPHSKEQDPQGLKAGTDYVIGPEDLLKVSVWKESDLSTSLPVRPDGKISLPLIGDLDAAGFTPTQLGAVITDKLKQYVDDPRVTVVVTAINSKKIFILGSVNKTGSYALLPNMTVLQALSNAGGFSQFADLKHMYVLRTESGKQTKLSFNYKRLIKGEDMQQNIVLKPGDTIVIP